jgi:hypothetical protein
MKVLVKDVKEDLSKEDSIILENTDYPNLVVWNIMLQVKLIAEV